VLARAPVIEPFSLVMVPPVAIVTEPLLENVPSRRLRLVMVRFEPELSVSELLSRVSVPNAGVVPKNAKDDGNVPVLLIARTVEALVLRLPAVRA
jgi:hypothetical protein